jgi:crossover junction endodeoxyribonuclease RusA
MIELELPMPPSANRYWRYVNGKVLKSKQARDYIKTIGDLWMVYKAQKKAKAFGKDQRLQIYIQVFPPNRIRRDLDNLLKVLMDSLEHAGLFTNDEQIDDIRIMRMEIYPGGKMVICLRELIKGG